MDNISNSMNSPRILIGGERSGTGKSTVTLGILLALHEAGLNPQPYKTGPDFLDPMHHDMLLSRRCRNLDTWMFPDAIPELFRRSSHGAGISVIEGVMGLFDGIDGRSEAGSSAHLAKVLRAPVILVVDASGSARSVGAVVEGFRRYDPGLDLAGVIANRIGSRSHERMVAESIRGLPFLGGLPKNEEAVLDSRHLGLIPAREQFSEAKYDSIRKMVSEHIDIDTLIDIARSAPPLPETHVDGLFGKEEPRVRLGLARDEAFNFYYQDSLDILESYGAELVPFSPLNDKLPDVDGLYFGGGFPELWAADLEANESLREEVRECSAAGMPIYAECGGMMYLCMNMKELNGKVRKMCGVFDASVEMSTGLKALSYVEVLMTKKTVLGPVGTSFRGHEFHYSFASHIGEVSFAYLLNRGHGICDGLDGMTTENTLASYTHLHLASNPSMARCFVDRMDYFRSGRL